MKVEEKLRKQLLDLMSASKTVLETKNNPRAMDAAISKLQSEYVKSIILVKSTADSKIPALLKPNKAMFVDQLSVGLGESNG